MLMPRRATFSVVLKQKQGVIVIYAILALEGTVGPEIYSTLPSAQHLNSMALKGVSYKTGCVENKIQDLNVLISKCVRLF